MASIRKFHYANSLEGEFFEEKCVSNVKFAIDRHHIFFQEIEFKVLVSKRKAVEVIECFLSKPMTKDYYDVLFEEGEPWEKAKKTMKIKGDALGDAMFIEQITIDENGNMEFLEF